MQIPDHAKSRGNKVSNMIREVAKFMAPSTVLKIIILSECHVTFKWFNATKIHSFLKLDKMEPAQMLKGLDWNRQVLLFNQELMRVSHNISIHYEISESYDLCG